MSFKKVSLSLKSLQTKPCLCLSSILLNTNDDFVKMYLQNEKNFASKKIIFLYLNKNAVIN